MATKYFTTNVKFTPSGRNSDHVYKVVEAAGAAGCVWADIAAQMPKGVAPSGVYSYLHSLKKEGLIRSEEIESQTSKQKDEAEAESVTSLLNRGEPRWKCPTCGKAVREEMSKRCRACREKTPW